MSKGSRIRPKSISNTQFAENWDKIFGKKTTDADKPINVSIDALESTLFVNHEIIGDENGSNDQSK